MTLSPLRTFLIVMALWCAGLGAAAQFAKMSVMFDLLTAAYPGRGPGIGFMVSVVGLVGLVFGTTAGLLVQRAGYRRVLVAATTLGALMSALQATMPGFGMMMASRIAEGASHLAVVVAGPVLIAQVTPLRRQGLAMTLWASFFGVSFAVTAWAGLPLAETYGPAALFAAHAGVMALLAVVLWHLLPRDVAAPGLQPITLASVLRQHRTIYASPFIAAPALGFVFYTLIYVAVLTLLPPLLPTAQRGVAASGMPLISIAVSLTLGVALLKHMQAYRLVQLGLALTLLCSLGLGVSWGTGAALVAALALASALGLVQGASFASIPQLNQSAGARAMASGAVAQMGNLGTTTGTPLLAWLLVHFGISGLVGFLILFPALGIAVHTLQARRRNHRLKAQGQTMSTEDFL